MLGNQCCPPSVFTIFTGDAKTMLLKAVYSDTGDPLDLTSCTAIVVSLPNADGSVSALSIAGGQVTITSPANLGKFQCAIASIVSAVLLVGELQSFGVTFTISGNPQTVWYCQALTVLQA